MKSINQYIIEALENKRLNEVVVKYDCNPSDFYVQCPDSFQENDVVQYMNDKLLNELPSSQKYSETFFGKNADNIYDTYFEYDGFEKSDSDEKPNLEWDPHYSVKKMNDGDELVSYCVKNLTYTIKFDRFDLENVSNNNVQEILNKIFNATVSNEANQYPVELTLDDKNITFH